MTLAPGTTIGRYQILEPLGQGGMATVYKAFQPSLQREVALKVLRPGFAQDPEFRQRFEREAIAIARLRHPHIVQVFDFEVAASGEYALAMEFLEGGTLKERLTELAAQGKQIDPNEAVRIVSEVADALGYAHDKGIVHRDVKPSNVMLGRRDWAIVTDFGIARILDATAYTQTGVGIGTPEYMAPEQGMGKHVDHRADIYALGVMAYQLLVGRLPYRADTPMGVVLAHINDPLPLPSKANPGIGRAIEKALLRALAKDPVARFGSAADFADALRAGLAADDVGRMATVTRTRPPPAAARPSAQFTVSIPSVLGQRWTLAGAAAGVALLAIAGVTFAGSFFGSSVVPGAEGAGSAPSASAPAPTAAPTSTGPPAAALAATPTSEATASPAPTSAPPVVAPTQPPAAAPTVAPTRQATAPPRTPAPTVPPTAVPTVAPAPASTPSVYALGQTAVLSWEFGEKSEIEVTVLELVDPASSGGGGADSGDVYVDPSERLVAFRVVIKNRGPDVYDEYPADLAEVIDAQGRQYQADASDPVSPGFDHLRIGPGVAIEAYISFELPKTATVSGFVYSASFFDADTARWRVP